jgi:serine/threonine-protein kinase
VNSPAAQPARDLSGKRLGRYEMLAQLASGGMATVYVARAQGVAGFERLVAIKVLHPHLAHDDEFISMFLDEARLAARIRHPNVVPTLDISDSQGDGYFLVMEYIEGDHLGALLREAARGNARLSAPVTMRIVIDALEGLSAAHTLKDGDGKPLSIVHRDISPHNILLGTDGVARITDFGVAKAEVRLSSTRDGQFKGKLAYMAPEQASNGTADQRSDLFSMGIVLWEALTGRRLFRADNNGELLNRLLNAPIPVPSEYVAELAPLDPVMKKALARDPAERYQTAAELVEAIEGVAGAVGGLASPRAVGKVVREWLGTKIESESTRIRTAIDSLGRSEVSSAGGVPRPEGSALTPVTMAAPIGSASETPSMVRPINGLAAPGTVAGIKSEDATIGATPRSIAAQAEGPRPADGGNQRLLIAAIVILLLVIVIGGGAMFAFGGSTPPATTVAAPIPSTTTLTPPSTAAEVVPPSTTVAAMPPASVAEVAPPPESEAPPATEAAEETHSSGHGHARRVHRTTTSHEDDEDDDDLLANPYRH